MMATTTGSEIPQLSLKKKKSLRQLFIPSRQKSTRSVPRKRSPTPPVLASNDSGLVTAIAYHQVAPAAAPAQSVEQAFASSSRASSSVLSERSSRRPSSSRKSSTSRQPEREALIGSEPFVEGLNITQQRPTARKRASTLTNFSKPYGALQDSPLIQDLQPKRKTSYQTLRDEPSRPRHYNRSFTDSAASINQRTRRPSTKLVNVDSLPPTAPTSSREYNSERLHPWVITQEAVRESTQSVESSKYSSDESKHGSTFTKVSSTSDTTIDAEYIEDGKDEFTENDVIDMYADLEDDECQHPGETQYRMSAQIADAMNAPIGSLPSPNSIPKTTSTPLLSPQTIKRILHQPPALQNSTATHDMYGFRKASRDVTIEAYDVWFETYAKQQSRRGNKWVEFLQDEGILIPTSGLASFPLGIGPKVQRYIRKGIPPAWRGEAWFYYAGGSYFLNTYPGHYVDLIARSQTDALSRNDKDAIERDLHRTFPDNLHFKPEVPGSSTQIIETPIMTALRRVLSAFAIDHPKTGYCQSLNFIAGLLLLFLPEEKAYWMLHKITTEYLPGAHYVSLEGTEIDIWVLLTALKQANPSVWAKIGGAEFPPDSTELPPVKLCLTNWFMSAFIGTLPIESVLRVWDVWFNEGSKTLFRVALAIFKSGETQIKSVQDSSETLQVVQSLPRKMVDPNRLFDLAFSRGEVGRRWIEKKRAERRESIARPRTMEKAQKLPYTTEIVRPATSGEDMRSPASPDMNSPESPRGTARTWGGGSRPVMTDL